MSKRFLDSDSDCDSDSDNNYDFDSDSNSDNKNNEYDDTFSKSKKYKSDNSILVDNEYCVKCNFGCEGSIFTRYYVQVNCPLCQNVIMEHIGFGDDYMKIVFTNEFNLVNIFTHIRNSHKDEFICIKNIISDVKSNIIKFTLTKKL
jgi:hypothetical protein